MPLHVSSTCAHHQEVKYRCDDTRGCVMQYWPPDGERMCSKHVEAWNKHIVKQKFCASGWLITEINIYGRVCPNLWSPLQTDVPHLFTAGYPSVSLSNTCTFETYVCGLFTEEVSPTVRTHQQGVQIVTNFLNKLKKRHILNSMLYERMMYSQHGKAMLNRKGYVVKQNYVSKIKIDQLDVTCFIISLFTAQHVSNVSRTIFRSLRLIVDLFRVLYCSGSMCVGVTVWFGWGGAVSLCRLKQCFSHFIIYCSTCFEC